MTARPWLHRRRLTLLFAVPVALLLAVAAQLVIRPAAWQHQAVEALASEALVHVDTDLPLVALTIDDAPSPEVTPGILAVLARHGVHATFFVIGSHAERHPALVDSIGAAGHEVGNHLYLDRPSIKLSDGEFLDALRRTHRAIGSPPAPRWCRPGSGWADERLIGLMAGEGYRACLASVYPLDLTVSDDLAARHFVANARPGAILVLHDGGPARAGTIQILEAALPQLRQRGFEVVTVSELVARTGATGSSGSASP